MTIYRNKSNGSLYVLIDIGTDCTNARDDETVVIYRSLVEINHGWFVRSYDEFHEKFERWSEKV